MGKDPDAIRREIEQTRAQMDDTVEAIGYKADVPARAKDSVNRKVEAVQSTVKDAASRIGDTVRGRTDQVGDAVPSGQDVKRTARKAVGIAQENPLGLAIGAVAVGFLAGLMVPSTRVEDERLGPVADQVKDKVKETGQEAFERGKDVAQQAVQSATETVKEQGQEHGQELADSARQSAEEIRADTR
jgi:gas vesicle protein